LLHRWPPSPGSPSPLAFSRRFGAGPARAARRGEKGDAPTASLGSSMCSSATSSVYGDTDSQNESLHDVQMNWKLYERLRADSLHEYDESASLNLISLGPGDGI